jgi:hypothetical protein
MVAALLFARPHVGEAVFVLVMAAASYVRQFGPRASAFGMISYISVLVRLLLHASPAQVPIMAVRPTTSQHSHGPGKVAFQQFSSRLTGRRGSRA